MRAPTLRSDVYRTYWTFAAERHRIFEARVAGAPGPWTQDPILSGHRFCNAFRAADRVSQHLIQTAALGERGLSEADVFVRVVLHRLFSRPSTWNALESALGTVDATSFDERLYGGVLDQLIQRNERIYTGAFILCANRAYGHQRKHRNHLALVSAMLAADLPARIADAASLRAVYEELLTWPLVGPFMAYQLAIDLNYSPLIDFSEDEFTVPGPGARRGLAKVFRDLGGLSPGEAIHWLVDQQDVVEDQIEVVPPTLFGRRLHAIDCQNLLCEVDKYCRVAYPDLLSNRSRIKQRYAEDPAPIHLMFPPEWDLDQRIPMERRHLVDHPASI